MEPDQQKNFLKNTKNPKLAYDDASFVEKCNNVKIVLSDPSNIKITTPQDLKLANLYLSLTR